jgi:hypothetical protein
MIERVQRAGSQTEIDELFREIEIPVYA